MNTKLLTPRFLVLTGMILIAAFSRLIPHPPNFTAVAAIALFGGAFFDKKWNAFLIPLTAMFLTDIILGFHRNMMPVYLAFILIAFIGLSLRNNKKITGIFLASISASVSFFIITNFSMWLLGTLYPKTGAGLAECFIAAIPFFHYTLLGDLFYVGILFGAFELAKVKFPKLAEIKA
jgi:hypothetical protein